MQMNKPSPRLAILRAQLAAKAADESFARTLYSYSAQNPRTRHHYHPDHNEDLASWLKTLAPAKPAAPKQCHEPARPTASGWRIGSDVPPHERVGLWHLRLGDGDYTGAGSRAFDAATSNTDAWDTGNYQFRRAALGTNLRDRYDEARYAATEPAADVWHSEAPSVAGVYAMDHVSDKTRNTTRWCAWFDGAVWHGIVRGQDAWAISQARREGASPAAVEWLRLIEADAPAARLASTSSADGAELVGAKLTHSVCIKAYISTNGTPVCVGQIVPFPLEKLSELGRAAFWRSCDKDGWVPHIHTADSVCPVPSGLQFEVRRRDGIVRDDEGARELHHLWSTLPSDQREFASDFVAWRPIAKDAS